MSAWFYAFPTFGRLEPLLVALGALLAVLGLLLAALSPLLGRSWPLLAALGPLLGRYLPSWAALGRFGGALGAPKALSKRHLLQTRDVHEMIVKQMKNNDFCYP